MGPATTRTTVNRPYTDVSVRRSGDIDNGQEEWGASESGNDSSAFLDV